MSIVLPLYPDAEAVMCDLLDTLDPAVPAVTFIDPAWDGQRQFVVQRTGGSDDGVTDRPVLQVDALGPNRSTAWLLARQAQQLILAARDTDVNGVGIDNTDTFTGAQEIPDLDPDDRKVTLSYTLEFRRQF